MIRAQGLLYRLARWIPVGICVGGAFVLYASAQTWWVLVTDRLSPLPPLTEPVTGKLYASQIAPLAIVAIAGGIALWAARAWGQRIVGLLIVLSGLGIALGGIAGFNPPPEAAEVNTMWPAVSFVGGLLIVLCAAAVLIQPRKNSTMGARFEKNSSRDAPDSDEDTSVEPSRLWDGQDRGVDLTYRR